MLGTILNLFGRSPFAPLQSHMDKVASCVHLIRKLFEAIERLDYDEANAIAEQISDLEHQADLMKNGVRTHLPKSLFLPIDRAHLLEILSLQDRIADKAQDIAVLVTVKPVALLSGFKEEFKEFLDKNISAFDAAFLIIKEMNELLESSFGGIEAEKVRAMIEEVCFKEHEVDVIQRKLLKKLFAAESEMSYTTFYVWQKTFESVANISNLSENLALRVRMTLELK